MSIRRARRKTNYSVISNTVYNNNQLSWMAMGMLSYILSKPDDWTIMPLALIKVTEGTAKHSRNNSVYNVLRELKDTGFITMRRYADGSVEYTVHDEPVEPDQENPERGNGGVGNDPSQENPNQGVPKQANAVQDLPDVILNTDSKPNTDLKPNNQYQPTSTPVAVEQAASTQAEEPVELAELVVGLVLPTATVEEKATVPTPTAVVEVAAEPATQPAVVEATKVPETPTAPVLEASALVPPPQLPAHDQAAAKRYVCGLQPDHAQLVLDTLAGKLEQGGVDNPIGLLRSLVGKISTGQFDPSAGIAWRAGLLQKEKAAQAASAVSTGRVATSPTQIPTSPAPTQVRRLVDLTNEIKGLERLVSFGCTDAKNLAHLQSMKDEWAELSGREWGNQPAATAATTGRHGFAGASSVLELLR